MFTNINTIKCTIEINVGSHTSFIQYKSKCVCFLHVLRAWCFLHYVSCFGISCRTFQIKKGGLEHIYKYIFKFPFILWWNMTLISWMFSWVQSHTVLFTDSRMQLFLLKINQYCMHQVIWVWRDVSVVSWGGSVQVKCVNLDEDISHRLCSWRDRAAEECRSLHHGVSQPCPELASDYSQPQRFCHLHNSIPSLSLHASSSQSTAQLKPARYGMAVVLETLNFLT